jgi:hypothetical protein
MNQTLRQKLGQDLIKWTGIKEDACVSDPSSRGN